MTAQDYLRELAENCHAPRGFRLSTTHFGFHPVERPDAPALSMDLSLMVSAAPSSAWAACATQNLLVSQSIQRLRALPPEAPLQALLINNRISNVGIAEGKQDIEQLASLFKQYGIAPRMVLPISTGIIGWRLPLREMSAHIPTLYEQLGQDGPAEIAAAIMTTDRYPKARSVAVGEGHILGIAKGAGMIEPQMATMLVFFLTDLAFNAPQLAEALQSAVAESFNTISIDGDQSTSDLVMLLSSQQCAALPPPRQFQEALTQLAIHLAQDIVRNGEGVGHLVELQISEAPTQQVAIELGRAILRSRLVATAIHGNDPNVGRIMAALGSQAARMQLPLAMQRVVLTMGEHELYRDGVFCLNNQIEQQLTHYLQTRAFDTTLHGYPQRAETVKIAISLGSGKQQATLRGGDLTEAYIHENADYRS